MLAYGITFISFLLLYFLFGMINPISRIAIQKVALIKYKEGSATKYLFVYSRERILKELIYTKNLNHLDIPVSKFEAIYFFNKGYYLNSFDGHHVRLAKDDVKEEIMANVKVSFLNIYHKYAVSRFVSFVRGDYENSNH